MIFYELIPFISEYFGIDFIYIQVGIILGLLLIAFILIRILKIEDAYLQIIIVVAFIGFMAVDGLIPLFLIYIFAFGSVIAVIFEMSGGDN